MRRLIILGCLAVAAAGCGKRPADRLINVNSAKGREVVAVRDYKWRFAMDRRTILGGKQITQDNQDQFHIVDQVEPADQKAYDTVFEYLTGRAPLKAD